MTVSDNLPKQINDILKNGLNLYKIMTVCRPMPKSSPASNTISSEWVLPQTYIVAECSIFV